MGIGPDIADVLDELGTLVTIIKHDGSGNTQEYIDYEVKIEANSPFLTQYMVDCTLRYNTVAVPGDIIRFDDDDTYYILTAGNKTRFEQSVVTVEGILYRCNMIVDVKRLGTASRDSDYNLVQNWIDVVIDEPVLLTGSIEYYPMDDRDYAKISTTEDNLHISGNIGLRVGDRIERQDGIDSSSGVTPQRWEVKGIAKYRLNNVSIVRVAEDTRE